MMFIKVCIGDLTFMILFMKVTNFRNAALVVREFVNQGNNPSIGDLDLHDLVYKGNQSPYR
ncbi:hypothetical protein J2S14_003715 [Lederbergia wuyishanensis]|uniref:Uncharacterized protein n=1 Tax=Lederbergia wuyishanensis TaxID=1347903 RepID=A0ABU0D8Z6_9BACI|nr:hypothetical protein [Lederbergia wuyishanensis]